jgi:hypothetical protein
VVLDRGIAFRQPSAVGGGGLERETAVDTPRQITPGRIQGGGRQGVTTRVKGEGPPAHRLQPWRQPGIASVEGTPASPDVGGYTPRPGLGRVVRVGPVAIGAPDGRSMVAQDCWDDPVAPAGAHHLHAALGLVKDPFPWGASGDPRPSCLTADQSAAAPPGQPLRPSLIPPGGHPLAEVGQGPVTARHPHPGVKRADRRASRMAWGYRRSVARRSLAAPKGVPGALPTGPGAP